MEELENIHFGQVNKTLQDWRKIETDDNDNDEDLPIQKDVKNILGFDPDEIK